MSFGSIQARASASLRRAVEGRKPQKWQRCLFITQGGECQQFPWYAVAKGECNSVVGRGAGAVCDHLMQRTMTKRRPIRPATLNDVAHEAVVSLTTAARVLRGDEASVSDARRERVLNAAQKLHYVPNHLARVLKGGSHRSIGLVVGDMSDPYFGEIAQSVSVTAQSRSLVAIVANMHRDPQLEIRMCGELWEHRVNGVILAGGGFDQITYNDMLFDLVRRLQSMNILVVALTERSLPIPCFSPDNERAGALAAERLSEHSPR